MRGAAEILLALERECVAAEAAIKQSRWADCETSWRSQRRLTHELELTIRTLIRVSPEYRATMERVARVERYREAQLQRLRALNRHIAERLATLEKFKTFSRTTASRERTSLLLDVNS